MNSFFILFLIAQLIATLGESSSSPSLGSIPSEELASLQAIYAATNGDEWNSFYNHWNFSTGEDPCLDNWEGVKCNEGCTSKHSCYVVSLQLNGGSLDGTLPSQIGDLTHMSSLSLSGNNIYGSIPPELWANTALALVDIDFNALSYPFDQDDSLCGAVALSHLDLSHNSLSGRLPSCIGQLTNMFQMVLSHNRLTGPLPSSMGDMETLYDLEITDNLISEVPSSIGKLSKMGVLTLDRNAIGGEVLPSVQSMGKLVALSVGGNVIEGTIPSSLCGMTQLQTLVANGNQLQGTLPSCFGDMLRLYSINFCTNRLQGTIPEGMGLLKSITLSYNSFSKKIPDSLMSSPTLQHLNLTGNSLTGQLPASSAAAKLQSLYVNDNQLSGTLPPLSPMLYSLDVSCNRIGGTVGSTLVPLSMLQMVSLKNNEFEGDFPSLSEDPYPYLQQLLLRGNLFQHSISSSIGPALPALWELDVSDNVFTGSLPETFFAWRQMECVNFSFNMFTGRTPPMLEEYAPTLSYFDVSHNLMTGPIDAGLTAMNMLFEFLGNANSFSGTIPEAIGEMCLYLMKFDNNHLSGTLPRSISEMGNLRTLMLYSNHLTGTLDGVFSMVNNIDLAVLDVSENDLRGTVPTEVFHLPSLKSLSLAKNCFSGELPRCVCAAYELEVLDFDGMTSGDYCRYGESQTSAISHITGNQYFYVARYVEGTIPDCIFNLVNLTQVYMSGNGIYGAIPNVPQHSKLASLALSNNRLSGTIPVSVQMHTSFVDLRLNNNRLRGTIEHMSNFSSLYNAEDAQRQRNAEDIKHMQESQNMRVTGTFSASMATATDHPTLIALQNNRLSGDIPSNFLYASNINILEGNLFACNAMSDLPHGDPERSHYFCGSSVLDISLYALCIYVGFVVVALVSWKVAFATREGHIERRETLHNIRDTIVMQYSDQHMRDSVSVMLGREKWDSNMPVGAGTTSLRQSEVSTGVGSLVDFRRSSPTPRSLVESVGGKGEATSISGEGVTDASTRSNSVVGRLSAQAYNRCIEMRQLFGLFLVLRKFSIFIAFIATFVFLPMYVVLKQVNGDESSSHTYQYGWNSSGAYLQGDLAAFLFTLFWSMLLVGVVACVFVMNKPVAMEQKKAAAVASASVPTTPTRPKKPSASNAAVDSPARAADGRDHSADLRLLPADSEDCDDGDDGDASTACESKTRSCSSDTAIRIPSRYYSEDISLEQRKKRTARRRKVKKHGKKPVKSGNSWGIWAYLAAATLLNCTVLLCVNLMYIYVSFRADKVWTWASIVFVAGFKTLWNVKVIPLLLYQASVHNHSASIHKGNMAVLQSLWIMFNNVVAPCVATLGVDSSCYESVFIPAATVTTNYAYPVCESFNTTSGACLNEVTLGGTDMTFHPPFIYSCQCSSSLLVKYVPVFIIVYGFTGIVLPVFHILVMDSLEKVVTFSESYLARSGGLGLVPQPSKDTQQKESVISRSHQQRSPATAPKVSGSSSTTSRSSFGARLALSMNIRRVELLTLGLIPPLLWPIRAIIAQGYLEKEPLKKHREGRGEYHSVSTDKGGQHRTQRADSTGSRLAHAASAFTDAAALFYARNRNLYKFQSITCNVIASLAVLLTFGILYPPLALLITFYICATTSILHKAVYKHLKVCPDAYLDALIARVKRESNGLLHVLFKSMVFLVVFMSCFVGAFTIDQTEGMGYALFTFCLGGALVLVMLWFGKSSRGADCARWYKSMVYGVDDGSSHSQSLLGGANSASDGDFSDSDEEDGAQGVSGGASGGMWGSMHSVIIDTPNKAGAGDYYEDFDFDGRLSSPRASETVRPVVISPAAAGQLAALSAAKAAKSIANSPNGGGLSWNSGCSSDEIALPASNKI